MIPAACQDPGCHMRVGRIVRRTVGGLDRGLVVWSHGHGDPYARGSAPLLAENDAIIDRGVGSTLVTNCHNEFEVVPDGEWTSIERVKSVGLTWEKMTDRDDYEPDSFVFALVASLLRPPEKERVFNDYSWPVSVYDLILQVAETIDERVRAEATLAVAKSRLS